MLFSEQCIPHVRYLKTTMSAGSTGIPNMDGLSDLPWERVWVTIQNSGVTPVHVVGHILYMFCHS